MSDLTVEAAVKKLIDEGFLKEIPPMAGRAFLTADVKVENRSDKAILAMVIWDV